MRFHVSLGKGLACWVLWFGAWGLRFGAWGLRFRVRPALGTVWFGFLESFRTHWDNVGAILGLCGDKGKENGNWYNGVTEVLGVWGT